MTTSQPDTEGFPHPDEIELTEADERILDEVWRQIADEDAERKRGGFPHMGSPPGAVG